MSENSQELETILKKLSSFLKKDENIGILDRLLTALETDKASAYIENMAKSEEIYNDIKDKQKHIQEIVECTEDSQEKINEVFFDIFVENDSKEGGEEKYISEKLKNINKANNASKIILEKYNRMIDKKDANGENIKGILTNFNEACEQIDGMRDKIKELQEFYDKIFVGISNEDNPSKSIEPLEELLNNKLEEIDETISTAKDDFTKLKEEIEGLLPGATTAGLATAYKDQKEAADKKIYQWTWVFTVSIIVFIVAFVIYFYNSLQENFTYISFLRSLPFWIFSGFFTYYSTKQIAEYKKIMTEYGHKESLALTYVGFEKAIDKVNNDELKNDVLGVLVDAIQINPSDKLNSVSGHIPSMTALEKIIDLLPTDSLKHLSEIIKKKLTLQ